MRPETPRWILLPLLLAVACGGGDHAATHEAVEDAVEQVAEAASAATEIIGKADEVDDEWPFTLREVDSMRITTRVEKPMQESWRETVLEYQRPDRTRDVTTVVGGAGDYLDVADCVICMEEYRPQDATRRAREIAAALPRPPASAERGPGWIRPVARRPAPRSFDPRRGRRLERVRSRGTRSIEFGSEEVDVSSIAQIVDPAQCRFIADVLLQFSRGLCDGERDVLAMVEAIEERVAREGIGSVTEPTFGDRALARRFEVAAALNRLRSLRVVPRAGPRG